MDAQDHPVSLDQVEAWAGTYRTAPVARRLRHMSRTPIEVFRACRHASRHSFILESVEEGAAHGRYTFIGYAPSLELTCTDGALTVRGNAGFHEQVTTPAPYIASLVADHRGPRVRGLPPFTGGLAGYLSFDYVKYSEPTLRLDATDEEGFRDVDLMYFDRVIAFDHRTDEVFLLVTIPLDDPARHYDQAMHDLDVMEELVVSGPLADMAPLRPAGEFEPLFDRAGFAAAVDKAKRHITDGDIFQVVLSNRLKVAAEGSLFDTYQRLRAINPSPYLFYFSSDDLELAGASPETLVKLTGTEVVTFPLAGTRPRGATAEQDAALEADLRADAKELAEHTMLVDLGRNDLGKVAAMGTVTVTDYQQVLRFSQVMHLGSTVVAQVRPGVTATDVIAAVLPAGTLSGAPKVSACQILNDLEGVKRGVYGGAIGYIANTGDLDTCIAIRLAYKKGGNVYIRAGAGIVADSVADTEYDETVNKMKAVVNAISGATSTTRRSRS